jgi:DNA primase
MRIPDAKIDEVRTASDIVDVIGSYVRLKKRGKNFLGLCPFHQEKTPSFNVSPDRQMYHCFGCGVGGTVFTFIMEHDKVSFVEAVRTLAERAGIVLPSERPGDDERATEYEGLYAACRAAGLFFHSAMTTTVEGRLGFEYFRHRGFTEDTIRRFGLGYSMNAWDALMRQAQEEKIDLGVMEKAGLLIRREDGSGFYDRFRGRAMFPIFSASGRPIGFGARKLREDDQLGKYINSPETPIYDKSRTLYGLFQSKEAIREQGYAILVEGYADLISVYQSGILHVVASSGTALTEEQIRLIGRYARRITLVYDGDSAGSKASLRGVDLVIENGLDVSVAELPAGHDPDTFVKEFGREAFQKLVDGAVSFLDFKASMLKAEGLFATPEGKTQVVRSLVETIARMKDELKRTIYVKSVAEKYDIYESVLFRELESILGKEAGRIPAGRGREATASSERAQADRGQALPHEPMAVPERDLLKVMVENGPAMVQHIFSQIGPESFRHPDARSLVQLLMDRGGEAWEVEGLVNQVEDARLKSLIADLVFSKYEISKGWGDIERDPEPWKLAGEGIRRLRIRDVEDRIAETFRHLREAQARGESLTDDHQAIRQLQEEKKQILAAP